MEAVFLVILAVGLTLGIRLMLGQRDRARIQDYVAERGGQVRSIRWTPFGPGWFGEENARLYEVRLVDSDGRERVRSCKTRMFGGVYWTDA